MAGNGRTSAKEARNGLKLLHKLERKADRGVQRRDPISRPVFTKGNLQQAKDVKHVMSAWDQQLIAKQHPG